MASLPNYHVKITVILNDIPHNNNKFLEENINKNIKFHRLDSRMEEAVSKFQSVVEV